MSLIQKDFACSSYQNSIFIHSLFITFINFTTISMTLYCKLFNCLIFVSHTKERKRACNWLTSISLASKKVYSTQ